MTQYSPKYTKLLYLGPKGSYSDIAKNKFKEYYSENIEFIEQNSISQIIEYLVNDGSDTTTAILPIENSIEGVVRETQDKLSYLAENGYFIYSETQLAISHALIGYADNMDNITTITSHPQALAQCREFIHKNFNKDIELKPALSTSNGVESLSDNKPNIVAIGNEYCAKLYNIPIIKKNINDEKNNTTRFILISKKIPTKTDNNKISVVFSTENSPGALNKALTILEKHEINLSYIDSRPSRKKLGEYIFYADFAGFIDDNNISLALIELQNQVKTLNILSHGAVIKNVD